MTRPDIADRSLTLDLLRLALDSMLSPWPDLTRWLDRMERAR